MEPLADVDPKSRGHFSYGPGCQTNSIDDPCQRFSKEISRVSLGVGGCDNVSPNLTHISQNHRPFRSAIVTVA